MNPFTAHPQQQGINYIEHWSFAMGIAWHLMISMVAFVLHAMLPFIPIAPRHDLEMTSAYLMERNQWIETSKSSAHLGKPSDQGANEPRNERRNAFAAELS